LVKNHVIVFLVHYDDYKKIRTEIIENRIKNGKLSFNHIFSIWEWNPNISTKHGSGQHIVIRDYDGGIIGNQLGQYMKERDILLIVSDIESLYGDKQLKFIRKKPPMAYLIDVVLFILVSEYASGDEITVSLDDLMGAAEKYFPTWVPDCSQKSQIKKSWIMDCMNVLQDIKIVKRIDRDNYTIKIPPKKDLTEEIIKRLAILELKKRRGDFRKTKIEETDLNAKILDDFKLNYDKF